MKYKISHAALFFGAALCSQTVFSQQNGLEEVIVTAEKRATNVQDTPVAVSVFTGEELNRALISKSLDLQFNVPNMLMSKGNFSGSQISIRGIGNLAVGSASDSGTGNHFDGVYLNNGRIFEMEFYDAERIEVLRGPQGTRCMAAIPQRGSLTSSLKSPKTSLAALLMLRRGTTTTGR